MGKTTIVERLVSLIDEKNLFSSEEKGYMILSSKGGKKIVEINSVLCRQYLRNEHRVRYNKIPNSTSIREAVLTLEAKAILDGKKKILNIRVAMDNNTLYYDLSNQKGQIIEIKPGKWKVTDLHKVPVFFKSFPHQKEQVLPSKDGNLSLLLKYLNINPEQELLLLVYLISCFIKDFPHVLINLFGEAGSGKTTFTKIINQIVDPSLITAISLNIKDIEQLFASHWFVGFDNLSKINSKESDILCQTISGTSHFKRKLFTDNDSVIYSYRNCLMLNGVNNVVIKQDLLDRAIIFKLERISEEKRKPERELWEQFHKDLPKILGGIFDTLAKTLIIYPTLELPEFNRMADFQKWGYAIAEALQKGKGEAFLEQLNKAIKSRNEEAVLDNPLACAVLALMKNCYKWEGSPGKLLKELFETAKNTGINVDHYLFPEDIYRLGKALNSLESRLEQFGIYYQNKKNSKGNRHITLTRIIKRKPIKKHE